MSVRRSLLVLALLMIALPTGVFWSSINSAAEAENQLANLQVHTIERGTVEVLVAAIGQIEASQVARLSFPTSGRLAEVFVERDNRVNAGDPLARLENDAQRIAYQQTLLAFQRAELELERLRGPVDEDDIRIAQANLDNAWGVYMSAQNAVSDEDIRAAELAYEQARGTYDTLRAERDRAFGGYGSPTYQTLDAQTGAASFNAEIARLRLEQLRTGNQPQLNAAYARVVQAQRELERVEAGPQPFEIQQAEIAVRQAQSRLEQAEQEYYRTLLVAPFDGVVSALSVEVGGLVRPGVAVVELTDISTLKLAVQVDEIDISLIDTGLPARVQFDAVPNVQLPARLLRIAPFGSSDGGITTYDVDIALDGTDPDVRVGMTAEASIVVEERQDVPVVPNLYIRRDRGDRAYADVLRDGRLVQNVEVTLGLIGQEYSEIAAGLQPGDVVAIDLTAGRFNLFGE
jgi:HlyD family secretion protein